MKKVLAVMVLVLCVAGVSQATVYTWTGEISAGFWDERNWRDAAGDNPVGDVIANPGGVSIDLLIGPGFVLPSYAWCSNYAGRIDLMAGNTITVTGGYLAGTSGLYGTGSVVIGGTGRVSENFINGVQVSVSENGALVLKGTGTVISTTAGATLIDLVGSDATVDFRAKSVAEVTSLLGFITIDGVAADLTNATVTNDGAGTIVQAIPEPATMALLGLGSLLGLRRKK